MAPAGRLLLILLLGPASLSEGAANPLLEDVSGDLERRLAAGVDGLEVAGRRLNREVLAALYRARDFAPLWIEAKGATHNATTLFDVLSAAEAEGLNPADYGPDAIRQRLADADPARLAELELLLSSGLVRYGTDLQAGRLAPKKVDPSLFVYVRDVDPLALLESAGAAPDLARFLRDLAPSNPYYRRLRQVLAEHRRLAEGGGWPTLPDDPNLRLGDSGPRVVILRERLGMGAGAPAAGADPTLFDEEVEAAVRDFQERHGLDPDGVVGPKTRAALNRSIASRIDQIIVNMERWRWVPDDMGERYILVTMAGYELDVVE